MTPAGTGVAHKAGSVCRRNTPDSIASCAVLVSPEGHFHAESTVLRSRSSSARKPAGCRRRLVRVLQDWLPPAEQLYLYYPSRRLQPAGFQALLDAVKAAVD